MTEPKVIATIDMTKAVSEFPSINFFPQITMDFTADFIRQMICQGVTKQNIQIEVDSTDFAVTLAGSVYGYLNDCVWWGFTDPEYLKTTPEYREQFGDE